MTVNEFQAFAKQELTPDRFERMQGRPMSSQDKDMAQKIAAVSKTLTDVQGIFSKIGAQSTKYFGLEAYIIWRLAQLADSP